MVSNLEDMAFGFTIERAGAADFVADMTGARGGARLECLCLCGGWVVEWWREREEERVGRVGRGGEF